MQGSSFAILELDAQLCRVGLWRPDATRDQLEPGEVSQVVPALALSKDGDWLIGAEALKYRLVEPRACVLDLMGDEALDARSPRRSGWPFAPRRQREDGTVTWEIRNRAYPRAYLWSRILLCAREACEAAAQSEIRDLALVVGKGISPAVRRDLEQAAQLVRIEQLWWVDRVQALMLALEQREAQATLPVAVAEPSAQGADADPLSRIHEVLGVQKSPSGPEDARLSMSEFGATPAQDEHAQPGLVGDVAGDVVGEEVEEEIQEEATEATASEAPASAQPDPDLQTEVEDQEAAQPEQVQAAQEPEDSEAAPQGHWLWMADGNGLELAKVKLSASPEVVERSLIPHASNLFWQDQLVFALQEELRMDHELVLEGASLAMVRVWDACGKMMDRLQAEAHTEIHLPHLSVRGDASFHYEAQWSRRRVDALIASAVGQLRTHCEDETSMWQWGRYGSASEVPAFTRVAQQCEQLRRKDARLGSDDALRGAALWIAQRQRKSQRTHISDLMLGEIEWEHPSGLTQRCELQGALLPCKQDLKLGVPQPEDERPWSVFLCIPGPDEQKEWRFLVARVQIPGLQDDARVRVEVQRQGKVLVSRSPAAKNAGVEELKVEAWGLAPAQVDRAVYEQAQRDVARFVAMREAAMRKELNAHCSQLSKVLIERGDKMDDLLRTRLGEWVASAKAALNPEAQADSVKATLAALAPVHQGLVDMVETLTAPQKKALGLSLSDLPELVTLPEEHEVPSAANPWWAVSESVTPAAADEASGPDSQGDCQDQEVSQEAQAAPVETQMP